MSPNPPLSSLSDTELMQAALALAPPWKVVKCEINTEASRVDIHLDFARGAEFACPECGKACKALDTRELHWRHLDFFQHHAYLHARTPRADCPQCGPHRVRVPWARPDSEFTLLFEAMVMAMAAHMPIAAVARRVREHDSRIWRMVTHYVDGARAGMNHAQVERVGMDETASRRGQRYVSVFVDLDERRVLFATPGKDAATVKAFASDLIEHGGDPQAVKEVSMDMSLAFRNGAAESLPNAGVTNDRFHAVGLVNQAVDKVRREEAKRRPELKGTRRLWLYNPEKLSLEQMNQLEPLFVPERHLDTALAYQLRLAFQDLYQQPASEAGQYLDQWCDWCAASRLEPMIKVGETMRKHREGILRWFQSGVTNGILEGINSLIQAAKAKARGYRSDRNLITIIYLIAGKLPMPTFA